MSSLSNDQFQIFFNKAPLPSSASEPTAPQNSENVKRFTFSIGGVYQKDLYTSTSTSSESKSQVHLSVNEGLNTEINTSGRSIQPFSAQDTASPLDEQTDLYTQEAPDSAEIFHEEANRDTPSESFLSNNSKKIKKEKMSSHFRTSGSKKNVINNMKNKTKRNPWQPEEDDQVCDLVAKYGQSWALIASLMKGRSGKQIRDRYLNKLKPDINKGEWTPEEDKILMALCRKVGHKWSRIATQLPGRTEGQVKNRFYSHIKKRMPKWAGVPDEAFEQEMEKEEGLNGEGDFMRKSNSGSPLVKEETMSFGLNPEFNSNKKVNKAIQSLNCAGNYILGGQSNEQKPRATSRVAFGSLNISLNTFNQSDLAKKEERGYCRIPERRMNAPSATHVKGFNRSDPTDVISYDSFLNNTSTEGLYADEEIKSPYSQNPGVHLSSTRASSLQDKEFEDQMGNMWAKAGGSNLGNSNIISLSITNGNILTHKTPIVSKNINIQGPNESFTKMIRFDGPYVKTSQLDLSSGQNKINLKIC